MVVEMILTRRWIYPMPNIGIELAVRAYLTQMGIGLGKTKKGGQIAVALSFEGWKALVKAYLALAYDRGGERATAQTGTPKGRSLG